MKNSLRHLFTGIAAMTVLSFSACDNPESSKKAMLDTGAKVGNAVMQGSLTEFSKAIELEKQSAKAYASRGALKYTMGDRDGAIADFTKAIEINPKSVAAYSGRGTAKVTKGDIPGASADFIEAGKLMILAKLNPEAEKNQESKNE
ncbi:MAG: hypothetical protein NT163_05640 [Chlorobiales bacterium]|nr:hypothetical protein [Chlorobiales bacterium]